MNVACHTQDSIFNGISTKWHLTDALHDLILVWEVVKKGITPSQHGRFDQIPIGEGPAMFCYAE